MSVLSCNEVTLIMLIFLSKGYNFQRAEFIELSGNLEIPASDIKRIFIKHTDFAIIL